MSFRQIPTYEQPLILKSLTSSTWYRWWQDIHNGRPRTTEMTVTVGGSPFAYTAPSSGFIILRGGTVSAVQFTRSVTTLTGQTSGLFPVSLGDILTITYSGLPTVVFVPN